MTDDNHDDHKTAAELFAEWAQQHLQQQTGNIAHEFFTTETNTENKDD